MECPLRFKKNKIYLIKDSFGKKPLYYKHDAKNETLTFCSENRIFEKNSKISIINSLKFSIFHFKLFNESRIAKYITDISIGKNVKIF